METEQKIKGQDRFFNREYSWIEFNSRVLAEAMDESNPILERLKFMGIVTSNLDEFYMVRIARIADDEIARMGLIERAYDLMNRQNTYFMESLQAEMAEQIGLTRIYPEELTKEQRTYVEGFFHRELLAILTPIAVRQEGQTPPLTNLSLYLALSVKKSGNESAAEELLVVEMPKKLPRVVLLPGEDKRPFILIEDIVSMFADELCVGYTIVDRSMIRATRAQEFTIDEERDEDLADMIQEALKNRRLNDVVRFEVTATDTMFEVLKQKFDIDDWAVYRTDAWHDLRGIAQLAAQPGLEKWKRPVWISRPCQYFQDSQDIWSILKERDVVVHHPYDSFDAVIYFLSQAATDPDVLAIKQTLYRTAKGSAIIQALEKAAENGKQVTVLVELKARFDEEKNIQWARRLEMAGATVLYGVVGLKTHAKACLIMRREPEGIRRYVHLATGNYNEKTAQLYSDLGFFTSDEELTRDVSSFFNVITGYSQPTGLSKILISPYTMKPKLKRLIMREAMRSRKESPGLIMAKMNSLVDPEIIEALYHASGAGVKIKLNVRGICRLRPGIAGMSENIEVISIVDMFLEHSRIFYFHNGGDADLFLSSADWMTRNLDRRMEIMFPVEDTQLRGQLSELLESYFKDNVKSWKLLPDGGYEKLSSKPGKAFRVQEFLCKKAAQQDTKVRKTILLDPKPRRPRYNADDSAESKRSSF